MTPPFTLHANVIDVLQRRRLTAEIAVNNGRIASITPTDAPAKTTVLPGFIDSHIHVESSMLVPSEFARAASVHGTVGVVTDPHEIANVMGRPGVDFMLDDADRVPLKFWFGAPSCVPATPFETAGAALDADAVADLLDEPRVHYLSEVMNFPGVLRGDEQVMAKLAAAKARGMLIDGHAPDLRGDDAARYFAAGISTDHECFTRDEALHKLSAGCLIAIREGSAARNFDALHTLIDEHPGRCMLCSDDKHPDELIHGHINQLVKRALDAGHDLMNVLHAACVLPVEHYGMNVGLLRVGDPADFIEVKNAEPSSVLRTFIDGRCVAQHGKTLIPRLSAASLNHFGAEPVTEADLALSVTSDQVRVIQPADGQLITDCRVAPASSVGASALKLVVHNRYGGAKPAVALIGGFGLKRGAIASSVAHDSHNIVAVGADDAALRRAINTVVQHGGGLAAVDGDAVVSLPLTVAGLMSDREAHEVAAAYSAVDAMAKRLGCKLRAPFMTLSFMALLVIPKLKLSDLGLFDAESFAFTSVNVD